MKNSMKGFTLVELLAVIVILAIIALITVPIILGMINDARKDAAKDAAFGTIKAVQLAYARVADEVSGTVVVKFDSNSSITDQDISGNSLGGKVANKVLISGDKPTGGQVTIDDDGKISVEGLVLKKFVCSGDDSSVTCNPSTGADNTENQD